jgi:hypothetical protein
MASYLEIKEKPESKDGPTTIPHYFSASEENLNYKKEKVEPRKSSKKTNLFNKFFF